MLVSLPASDIRLINIYWAGERSFLICLKRSAESVQHEPSCLLADSQLPVQLHTGYAFEVGGKQVNPYSPMTKPDLGGLHYRSCLDTEHRSLLAVTATIIHTRMLDITQDICRSAIRTARRSLPAYISDPCFCFRLVIEHFRYLQKGNSFAPIVTGCIHGFAVSVTGTFTTK